MAVIGGSAILGTVSYKIYNAGEQKQIAIQATAQIKHDIKIRKSYAKVIKSLPDSSDNSAVSKFLLAHTSGTGQ